jgi:hypothetical protein
MLPCLNCKKEVESTEAKLFAQVYLCSDCYNVAERLYNKGQSELKYLLIVLKESIRVAALQGKLQFRAPGEDIPKKELLTQLAEMAEEHKCQQK